MKKLITVLVMLSVMVMPVNGMDKEGVDEKINLSQLLKENSSNISAQKETCVICQCDGDQSEMVKPCSTCNMYFHEKCYNDWEKQGSGECVTCKKYVLPDLPEIIEVSTKDFSGDGPEVKIHLKSDNALVSGYIQFYVNNAQDPFFMVLGAADHIMTSNEIVRWFSIDQNSQLAGAAWIRFMMAIENGQCRDTQRVFGNILATKSAPQEVFRLRFIASGNMPFASLDTFWRLFEHVNDYNGRIIKQIERKRKTQEDRVVRITTPAVASTVVTPRSWWTWLVQQATPTNIAVLAAGVGASYLLYKNLSNKDIEDSLKNVMKKFKK